MLAVTCNYDLLFSVIDWQAVLLPARWFSRYFHMEFGQIFACCILSHTISPCYYLLHSFLPRDAMQSAVLLWQVVHP